MAYLETIIHKKLVVCAIFFNVNAIPVTLFANNFYCRIFYSTRLMLNKFGQIKC